MKPFIPHGSSEEAEMIERANNAKRAEGVTVMSTVDDEGEPIVMLMAKIEEEHGGGDCLMVWSTENAGIVALALLELATSLTINRRNLPPRNQPPDFDAPTEEDDDGTIKL